MPVTDPIADMLTCIRNANIRFHEKVDVPASNIKESIISILKSEGFIEDYKRIEDNKQGIIRIYLKYGNKKKKVINNLKRVSKPGLRVYKNSEELPKVRAGLGVAIVSTSKGIMTCKQARKIKAGGEILCYIW